MKKLNTTYKPTDIEKDLYKVWEDNGYFKADNKDTRPYYSIVLPPPNVTGILHIGHVLNISIQDSIIRHRRMSGFNTLWLPGTDHAGIATQNKVERMLLDNNTTKEEIGREEFIKRTWDWKNKYGNIITSQLRKIGASLDWSRERFTMDEKLSKAVNEVFVKLYEDNLIYRGEYIVNWCPKDKTALADDEIEHEEKDSYIWHINYPIKDSNKMLTIATTRPETMLGDSGVAVNPNDDRYKDLIGKTVVLPLMNREIPIIADEYVDLEFGTGVVKMTPSHDPNDFEVGKRHNLEFINVMTEDAKINSNGGKYEGLDRFEARKQVLKDLDELGLLVKTENHKNSIGHCYRCNTIIEPRVSNQWFVKMKPLAKKALEVVRNGEITLSPKRTEKIYYNWLENIRDWCISRQIWWGHQIPAYYDENGNVYVAKSLDEAIKKAPNGAKLTRETDVLDTWFSSALWPFSTLGWPDDTLDLKTFFPATAVVTGADIIFFWVARMIMMSLYFKKEIPFDKVYFTGIVRDDLGRKMSKSLGNSPDPLDIIENKGADALRFSLLFNTSPGLDIKFSESLIDMGSNFMNKVWNASKFVLSNLEDFDYTTTINENKYKLEDKWILSRLNSVSKEIHNSMLNYNIDKSIKLAFEFFKGDFCDWYVEIAKTRIYGATDLEDKKIAQYVLRHVLDNSLRLLHPFIPYITEHIWQLVKIDGDTIMLSEFPNGNEKYINENIEKEFSFLQNVITNIRNIRAETNVSPSKKIELIFKTKNSMESEILINNPKILDKLSNVEKITTNIEIPELVGFRVVNNTEIYVPLADLIDKDAEISKINKEIEKVEKELERVIGKLNNPKFMEKAPENIVAKERGIELELKTKLDKLKDNLNKFK
ncbi:valine--tRNA ligase [Oceanivirga salmonicida]|uniref:valine--tRNA ligase n=1 Tax=Oceanivirga salmonicida TaxID=1769291 RepID=UPI000829EF24|nr:valine--tRNA ligase [Oceanivirga salmonicida]